jgi:Putative inner membrane protein (DUF1819)
MIKPGSSAKHRKQKVKSSVEPRQTTVTARLSGQGAMLEELRTVLPVIRPLSARDDARRAIVQENILRRPSVTSHRKIFEKLSVRYFQVDVPLAVARLVQGMQTVQEPLQSGLLAYTMLLWNDALVFLLGCEWLALKLAGPPYNAETADIEAELGRLSERIPQVRKWALATRRKVATNYLNLLRDCGYATGTARKRLRRPFIAPDVVLFGAQLIVGGGEPASRIPEHALFMAMGLSIEEVIGAFTELRKQGRVDFAIQGGMMHLTILGEAISR